MANSLAETGKGGGGEGVVSVGVDVCSRMYVQLGHKPSAISAWQLIYVVAKKAAASASAPPVPSPPPSSSFSFCFGLFCTSSLLL